MPSSTGRVQHPAKDGKDDFLAAWTFTSNDRGRFEGAFTPVLDRAAFTSVGPLLSDQHQVFRHMDGVLTLGDGKKSELKHFLCFAGEGAPTNGKSSLARAKVRAETGVIQHGSNPNIRPRHLGLERHASRRYADVLRHRKRDAHRARHGAVGAR
ncbi:MAG: DUF2804 family protein [Eubacteriales bacterium]